MTCITVGLAACLSGHYFTLIAAGHMSKFRMVPYAILLFGFICRSIETRKLIYFIMAGVVAGIGFSEQEDIMLMFALLALVYSIFKIVTNWPQTQSRKYILKIMGGGAIGAIFLICIMLPKIYATFLITLPVRTMLGGEVSTKEKWIFATNWSLPPEEITEFLVPCIFGTETSDPVTPYWGRLGRTFDWENTHRGLVNLRQHTVYLGVIPIVFAILGLVFILRKRKEHLLSLGISDNRKEVIFWGVAWLICVLFALGRYGPFYQIFYALPITSSIRAPVKFMHLVELCTAVLFAFGLDFFLTSMRKMSQGIKNSIAKTGFVWMSVGCAIMGIIAFIASVIVVFDPSGIVQGVSSIGLSEYAKVLTSNMAGAFLHTSILFLFCALIFVFAWRYSNSSRALLLLWVSIIIAISIDLIYVNSRFIRTSDQRSTIESNVVIDILKQNQPSRVYYPIQDRFIHQWGNNALVFNDIAILDLSVAEGYADLKNFVATLQTMPSRLWLLTNTKYIIIPAQIFPKLSSFPTLKAIMGFQVLQKGTGGFDIIASNFKQATYIIMENTQILDRAMLYYNWDTADNEKALLNPNWNPMNTLLVSGIGGSQSKLPADPLTIIAYKPQEVYLKVNAKSDGIILLNDHYDPNWKVWVDGKPEKLLKCNFVMRGVRVSQGEHEILFEYVSPYILPVMIRYFALFVAFSLIIVAKYK